MEKRRSSGEESKRLRKIVKKKKIGEYVGNRINTCDERKSGLMKMSDYRGRQMYKLKECNGLSKTKHNLIEKEDYIDIESELTLYSLSFICLRCKTTHLIKNPSFLKTNSAKHCNTFDFMFKM
jgi:hypothetical protein